MLQHILIVGCSRMLLENSPWFCPCRRTYSCDFHDTLITVHQHAILVIKASVPFLMNQSIYTSPKRLAKQTHHFV